ncbi:hypothetical protein ACJMK2_037611 [Sinanodonta woodiana]|uniref:Cytochrome P450 n=1 Tax=Sinanodonta woodiana TaxID=1069815 RepID=A0ABD3WL09_SINWO
MTLLEVFLIALVVCIILYTFVLSRSPKNLPPGPKPLPVVGNLLDFPSGRQVYKDFLKYREKYGNVVRLVLGPFQNIILVFGHRAIHKALIEQGKDFKFRPTSLYVIKKLFYGKGITFGNGDAHHKLRKFTLVALRDFGVGKKSLEERIQDEAHILADEFESYGGQPRDIRKTLQRAVANIIAGIIYGTRLDYGDPEFIRLIQNIDTIFSITSANLPENFFPFLAHLPNSKARKVFDAFDDMSRFARRRIKDHRKTFDKDNIRDFVDLYLQAEEHEDEEAVNEENMFRVIVDLFNAGTDTTSTTLAWAILYLMTNPDVQDQCHKEIIENIGSGRAVSLSDKEQLQYLDATIKETLRLACIAPLTPPHTVLEDTQFEGYTIPKESTILFHLNSVLTDPNIWETPEQFRPERFLTEEGKKKEKEFFIPFSTGPRSCLGKHLATMELFLFLGNLLQRFTLKIPPGCQTPSVERVHTGITCQPHPYLVCVVPN